MDRNRRSMLLGGAALSLGTALAPGGALAKAATPTQQTVGAQHRRIGRSVVTALLDGYLAPLPPIEPDVAPEALRPLFERRFLDMERYEVPVNAYLVNTPDRTVLVDAGGALPGFPNLGRLGANLAAIGVEPAQVDAIALTHLHPDHIGGLIGPDGSAAFPDAEVFVSEAEHAYWHDDAIRAALPGEAQGMVQIARAALAAYEGRVTRFTGEAEIVPGLAALPLGGHTPGHTGFVVSDGDERLLIWGDVVQVEPVQFARPDLYVFEVDPEAAIATRRRIMDRVAGERTPVAGMHLLFPGFGHVARDADAYAFVPAAYPHDL